jgi:pimeloyl-ACP methyl ester carboxylesterase
MPFVEVNGTSIYYEVHGEGPAVVLSHGIVGDTQSFAPLLPILATEYQVVVYDARGRGQSGDGPGPFSIADCAHDLQALLAYLGIQCAVHLGHSFGGRVALTFTLAHPTAVQGLILLAVMSAAPPQGAHRPQDNFRALVEQHGVAAAVRYRVEHGFLHVVDREAFFTRLAAEQERYAQYSTTGFLRATQAMATMPSLSERLGEIPCPVLALAGEYDQPYLPFLPLYQERIPHCDTLVVPCAGHFLVEENFAVTQQAIGAFLRKVWTPGP